MKNVVFRVDGPMWSGRSLPIRYIEGYTRGFPQKTRHRYSHGGTHCGIYSAPSDYVAAVCIPYTEQEVSEFINYKLCKEVITHEPS